MKKRKTTTTHNVRTDDGKPLSTIARRWRATNPLDMWRSCAKKPNLVVESRGEKPMATVRGQVVAIDLSARRGKDIQTSRHP
ncbi:hypothetical protein L484_005730 [Morus notabilis]|uniref:Uncharacterized protein n=1 Tax=Morus notabilis TaxID=981085 RepID=W9QWM3_9ROSA|nr:hypothetical protein L484_005730 [Morus notabilis]